MDALLIIDVQNDFVPGGSLAVRKGDEVVPVANRLMPLCDVVVATQDWHPRDHVSFATSHPGHAVGDVIECHGISQILWPVHCVQNSKGAELVEGLDRSRITHLIKKGTHKDIDSYSAFFDNGRLASTDLEQFLNQHKVGRVACLGLTTEYCVKSSALDARSLGFDVTLIEDGCRGVNLKPDDCDKALDEMRRAGVRIMHSTDLMHERQ